LKIKKEDIKKAFVSKDSPPRFTVKLVSGGTETFAGHELYDNLTPAARKHLRKLCGMPKKK